MSAAAAITVDDLDAPANDNARVEPTDAGDSAIQPSSGCSLPDDLTYPPGVTGGIVDLITGSARYPSRQLALAGALPFMGALAGRRYKGPTGLRTNVYVVALAPSGFSKEHSLTSIRMLGGSTKAGAKFYDKFIIDSPPRSPEGLALRLHQDPSAVVQFDEFGNHLKKLTGRKGTANGEAFVSALLELTGKASTAWGVGDRAAGRVESVQQPCLSMQAVSTPHTFWGALQTSDSASGFLPRILLIDLGTARPQKQVNPSYDIEDPPGDLIAAIERVAGTDYGGNLDGLYARGSVRQQPICAAPWDSPDVQLAFERFDDRIVGETARTPVEFQAVLTRTAEMAGKLALIVAVGVNPAEPVITLDIQEWANAVAESSLRAMLSGAEGNIADNEKQREYLDVRGFIDRGGKNGRLWSEINRHVKGKYDLRRVREIIDQLRAAGEVRYGEIVKQSGQASPRYWAKKHFPKEATPKA